MGKNETRRLNPAVLAEDLEILAALKDVQNYTPANSAYAVTAIDAINNRRIAAHDTEVQTSAAAESARDDHVAVQWELHNALLGVKDQITAQFGKDSNEVQSMKLKKKSEYKNPTRKSNKDDKDDPKT
ncbi:MAG TPA: hypothetical protein VGO68_13120 [Pyrinomonadaceae bacterium]|jgi:hypothetical protein|nr:hypothetical protein [Pyrinomonadaceae bacterium]